MQLDIDRAPLYNLWAERFCHYLDLGVLSILNGVVLVGSLTMTTKLVVDRMSSYSGITLIWPNLRTASAEFVRDARGGYWKVSMKNAKIRLASIELGSVEILSGENLGQSPDTGYAVSWPNDEGDVVVLPTRVWEQLEKRIKIAGENQKIMRGDPASVFCVAKLLAEELDRTRLLQDPENSQYLHIVLRDPLNKLIEAIEKAHTTSHLIASVRDLLTVRK